MTWNELIDNLNSIPEHRREENAIFMLRNDEDETPDGLTIDSMELVPLDTINTDCNAGDEITDTTFAIAQ